MSVPVDERLRAIATTSVAVRALRLTVPVDGWLRVIAEPPRRVAEPRAYRLWAAGYGCAIPDVKGHAGPISRPGTRFSRPGDTLQPARQRNSSGQGHASAGQGRAGPAGRVGDLLLVDGDQVVVLDDRPAPDEQQLERRRRAEHQRRDGVGDAR